MFERWQLLGDEYENDLATEYEDPLPSAKSDVYADDLKVTGDKNAAKRKPGEYDEETLVAISKDLGDVLVAGKMEECGGHRAALAMSYLQWAKGENHYTPDTKLGFVDAAMKILAPVLAAMNKEQRWRSWLQDARVEMHLMQLREGLQEKKANAQIEAALTEEGKLAAATPAAEANKARANIAAYLKASGKVTEISTAVINADALSASDLKGANVSQLRAANGALALDTLNHTLAVASALLEMTDDEFAQKQKILQGTPGLEHVRSRLDLVKAVHDLLAGGVSMLAKSTKLIAMVRNKPELATMMDDILKSSLVKGAGHVATGIAALSAVTTLIDDTTTKQQKWDATASLVGTAATLASEIAGASIGATYALASYSAELYCGARSGIMTAQMGGAFKSLTRDSDALVRATERLVVVGSLLDNETDGGQRAALTKIQESTAAALGEKMDTFLASTSTYSYEMGAAYKAGSYQTLREAFAPMQKHAGKRDPYEVIVGANEIIKVIAWCFQNIQHIVKAETAGGDLATVHALKADDDKKKAEQARRTALQKQHYEDLAAGQTEDPEGWSVDDGGGV